MNGIRLKEFLFYEGLPGNTNNSVKSIRFCHVSAR